MRDDGRRRQPHERELKRKDACASFLLTLSRFPAVLMLLETLALLRDEEAAQQIARSPSRMKKLRRHRWLRKYPQPKSERFTINPSTPRDSCSDCWMTSLLLLLVSPADTSIYRSLEACFTRRSRSSLPRLASTQAKSPLAAWNTMSVSSG